MRDLDPAELREVPVVVLTSTEREQELRRVRDLGALCCMTKPMDHKDLVRMMRQTLEDWLKAAGPGLANRAAP